MTLSENEVGVRTGLRERPVTRNQGSTEKKEDHGRTEITETAKGTEKRRSKVDY